MLARLTVAWVRGVRRAPIAVLVFALLLSSAAFEYVRANLGIQTNTSDMISPSLGWRQNYIDFERQFAQFDEVLAIVVDAQSAELASQAAAALSTALSAQSDQFKWVTLPSNSEFFRRNALLFLDDQARSELIDELVNAQPLIGRLNRDPSLKSVADLFEDALRNPAQVELSTLQRFANELANTIDGTLTGQARPISWRKLLGGKNTGDSQQIIRARPVLDYGQLFPAAPALQAVRRAAHALQLTPEHGIQVRITGGLAMSDEEMRTVSSGAERAAGLALLGVSIVLLVGLGSVRMVLITVVTLLVGLLWTAAFAAAAIGHLNMISVAFAVLYIGLGVDYAVHFALRYRELRALLHDHAQALDKAAGDVGVSIGLCALTTGVGFFAFVPTSFAGVSELGLIAGAGMFISLIATLTLMPALMSVFVGSAKASHATVDIRFARVLDHIGFQHPRAISIAAAVITALAAFAASGARFDENPLNLRDARGEAVSTYRELVAKDNNWSLDVLVAGAANAQALAGELRALPSVTDVISIESFVPDDQQRALAQIEELALLLGPDLDGQSREPSPPLAALPALARLAVTLNETALSGLDQRQLAHSLQSLQQRLAMLDDRARADVLARLQQAVVGTLSSELRRMGDALDARAIGVDDLPDVLSSDWRAPDGRLRLRIDAERDLNDREAMLAFVTQVQGVAPAAVGVPIVHIESAKVVVLAFIQAFALALVCITVILYVALRRMVDVLIVLSPLILGTLISVAVMVLSDTAFNFANVIALPLLLGVGVDSGIHMLARARLMRGAKSLASSSAARGVVTSALTTTVSFGNLAFSAHPGTASMGFLLTVGMVATLIATLVVLPAMVRLLDRGNLVEQS